MAEMQGWILVGLTTLAVGLTVKPARADLLGHVIVGGVTNQALTEVTQKACPDATGLGETACGAADVVVDVHQDISNTVNQQVQQSCQDVSGVGEDACQGIEDVSSFKKQLSEQVSHIHLFGSGDQGSSQSGSSNPANSTGNTGSTSNPNTPQNSPSGIPSNNSSAP